MVYKVKKEIEPQFTLLLVATIVSVLLWLASWYLPFVGYITYPLQLFATFIHEGGHVLATVLTGNSVQSLTVSPDTSGVVWSQGSGWFSQLFISSAGYLGTTTFGALLLAWMRYGLSSRHALYFSAGFIAVMTAVFGFAAPIFNFFSTVTVGSMAFTVFSGAVLAVGLFAVGKWASLTWANFATAFLAVQVLLNAVFSLVDLFFISTFTTAHSDAANMAAATGIPGIVWVVIWMMISIGLISLGLRLYAVRGMKAKNESLFED
ncbi:MAG: M50 family metallopeptidase [Acidobacteria bacterium]|nr:M50 family metallopeptidase [Acidobacteriota bacterium]